MIKHSVATIVFALAILSSSFFGQAGSTNRIHEYRKVNEQRLLTEYFHLLSIPNVASDTINIRRNADFLVERMQKAGLNPRLLEAADKKVPPVVYGEYVT